jgi:peptidoglycan-associated lipoprotein
MLKFGKFAALALAMAVAVGCSSKGGEGTGEGAVDPNAGYNAGGSGVDGSMSEEAALRAITTFYFEYDSSDLKPEAMRALDVHAKDLKANGARVVLEGHTDERGTREYNMALGERRAKAVQRYLVLQGVSPAQLELVSYGEERPVATGNDEQSWAQNRRVELRK